MGGLGFGFFGGGGGNQCIPIYNALTFQNEVSLLTEVERKKYAAISDILRILQNKLI